MKVHHVVKVELTLKMSLYRKNKVGQFTLFGLFAKLRCQDTTSNYDSHVSYKQKASYCLLSPKSTFFFLISFFLYCIYSFMGSF